MLAECKKIITNCDFVIPVKKALIDAFTEK
jgi:hypothetical protein